MPLDTVVSITKNELREQARQFSLRFREATSEKSERQTFWNDFFKIFGIDRKQVACFELLGHRSSTGGQGWIDMLYPGQMGVEHKSAGEDLDAAMRQLVDYLPALSTQEHPWLLVACDFKRFLWHNLNTRTTGQFTLDELADNLELFWWIAGYPTPHDNYDDLEALNLKATDLVAIIHDRLVASGYSGHPLRVWLTRVVFCLFADDSGIWDRAAFHVFLATRTQRNGSDLGCQLAVLFQVLNTPPDLRSPTLDEDLSQFTYVNGDLFKEPLPIPFCDAQLRDALLGACRFDWSSISPAIFGSMFQNVMTPKERRQLGGHYTTEQNILRVLKPLFLDDLQMELRRASTVSRLNAFLERLRRLTFLDPACGCGNFLVVAYREIRNLEAEALRKLYKKRGTPGQQVTDINLRFRVSVDQFYGIEILEFPAQIARTALYLMDHLCNRKVSLEFGTNFVRFPIPVAPHIIIGNALRINWNSVLPVAEASYIFGNPPFVGKKERTIDQAKDMDDIFETGSRDLDYVAAWFKLAVSYSDRSNLRIAFVATNSITQGEQVPKLWPRLEEMGVDIGFGYRTFEWSSEAQGTAQVHCVIIGFTTRTWTEPKYIYYIPDGTDDPVPVKVDQINGYLTDGPRVYPSARRFPLGSVPVASTGSMPNDGGHFLLSNDEAQELWAKDPIASKYIREILSTKEWLNGDKRWCLWLVDCPASDRKASPILAKKVAAVRELRANSPRKTTRALADLPYLFGEIRQPRSRFLCIPRHMGDAHKILPMAFFEADVIASDSTCFIQGADLMLFGILQSASFDVWLRSIGGRIKSDPRFSIENVYNTFPFRENVSNAIRKRIESASSKVIETREKYLNRSLSDLYDMNSIPKDLVEAHTSLDLAVDAMLFPGRRGLRNIDRFSILLEQYWTILNHH